MKLIPLTQGRFAQVSDDDFGWLSQWKWHYRTEKRTHGYAARTENFYKPTGERTARITYMHRQILGLTNPVELCDHIDRITLNNQRDNLRKTDAYGNAQNVSPSPRRRQPSNKYKGVTLNHNKYIVAQISIKGKNIRLGTFQTEEDAAMAYNEAAKKAYGESAFLNVIDTTTLNQSTTRDSTIQTST